MMKYVKYFAIAFLLALVTVIGATYIYLGGYKEVSFSEEEQPSFYIIYSHHRGPYHEISNKISSVEKWVKEQKGECKKSFGIYFDDPQVVAATDLNSWGGCILDKPMTIDTPDTIIQSELPPSFGLKASFGGSPTIGPIKVYPHALEWMKNQSKEMGPVLEVYNFKDSQLNTTYYFHSKEYREKLESLTTTL